MKILSGKDLSEKLYDGLKNITDKEKYKLIILTVGDDAASKVYVRNKIKACEKVGIACENIILEDNMSNESFQDYLEELIRKTFYDRKSPYIDGGIILQLPAPKNYENIFNKVIPPEFDVDGFGEQNQLTLYQGRKCVHYPATPKGIMTLLDANNIEVEGKNVVIVGRSDIVGKPIAHMMLQRNATVTICHSKTQNLEHYTSNADILIVAVGKPKFIGANHVKNGAVVIDVGINRTEEGICGDVDFNSVSEKCSFITPVPGGVGPMTVYSLIENTLHK
jgi:methylenetetrahydrofolate dehydrogenase (NADP+)/methenyltetrahydrofolate cyclohydrolase